MTYFVNLVQPSVKSMLQMVSNNELMLGLAKIRYLTQ